MDDRLRGDRYEVDPPLMDARHDGRPAPCGVVTPDSGGAGLAVDDADADDENVPTTSLNCRYVAMEATTTRASTVMRSIPTSETRTQASITIPLSRTRSRTSMRLLLPATRSSTQSPFPAGPLRQQKAQIVQVPRLLQVARQPRSPTCLRERADSERVPRGKNFRHQWPRNTLQTARLRLSLLATPRGARRSGSGLGLCWSRGPTRPGGRVNG